MYTGENVVIPYHLLDDVKSRKDDEIANIPALDRVSDHLVIVEALLTHL
jgi:hypothetical protein